MKKLFFVLFVIILVSIYWFRPALAEPDLGIDSAQALYKKYLETKRRPGVEQTERYTTPPIFEEHQRRASTGRKDPTSDSSGRWNEGDAAYSHAPGDTTLSVGSDTTLRPYGADLFTRESELNVPSDLANAEDYVLGPGDNLLIYLWGRVEKEFNLTVDREGKIFIPKVGNVIVWGKKLSDFETTLKSQLSKVYSDFRVTVSLGKIRSIRVYLIGEVFKPGAYTVSSLTTLFNALYLAGGPTDKGSYRSISLLRSGKKVAAVDLYDFLIRGDNGGDLPLKSGDAIFVPIVGSQVAVNGEVKRPAIYELRGEETAATMIAMAGGKTSEGFLRKVTIKRIAGGDEPRLMDINVDPQSPDNDCSFTLLDGDSMTVRSMYDVSRNFVTIAGMVKHPGKFERSNGMTVSTLLDAAQLRPDNVYMERANIFRTFSDNRREAIEVRLADLLSPDSAVRAQADIMMSDRDSMHVYAIDELERAKFVYVDGEVKRPGQYTLYEGMTLSDLIFLSGDVKRAAYLTRAEIARTDSLGEVTINYVDLVTELPKLTRLHEDDRVYIRQIPEWSMNRRVKVEGEVMFPGEYTLASRDESLYQLIQRCGGFTKVAFPDGLVLERRSIEETLQRRNLDNIVRSTTELERDSSGRVRQEDQVNIDHHSLGRIVIDVKRMLASKGKDADIVLEPGDKIFVPQEPSGVSVMGAVGATGTIKFEKDKNVDYYLQRAGGLTKQANKNEIRLVKADGRVYSGSGVRGQKTHLGDVVIVPSEIKKDRDTLKDISSTMSIITGLATSVFILTKL